MREVTSEIAEMASMNYIVKIGKTTNERGKEKNPPRWRQ